MMNSKDALTTLAALANETRLELVRTLVPLDKKGMTAGELSARAGMSASRLSFHLSVLENAGLITSRRESRNIYYSVRHQHLGALISYLMKDCCGSHPDVCACMRQMD